MKWNEFSAVIEALFSRARRASPLVLTQRVRLSPMSRLSRLLSFQKNFSFLLSLWLSTWVLWKAIHIWVAERCPTCLLSVPEATVVGVSFSWAAFQKNLEIAGGLRTLQGGGWWAPVQPPACIRKHTPTHGRTLKGFPEAFINSPDHKCEVF